MEIIRNCELCEGQYDMLKLSNHYTNFLKTWIIYFYDIKRKYGERYLKLTWAPFTGVIIIKFKLKVEVNLIFLNKKCYLCI